MAFHADGKTFVSKGLASNNPVEAPPVAFLSESFDYLSGRTPRPAAASGQTDLRSFIDSLSTELPGGSLIIGGTPYPLVPFCAGPIKDELAALLRGMGVAFQTAENEVADRCAEDYAKSTNPANAKAAKGFLESAQARESLFIIHLRALLKHIRTEYGV